MITDDITELYSSSPVLRYRLGDPEQSGGVSIDGIDPIGEEKKPFAKFIFSYMPMGTLVQSPCKHAAHVVCSASAG